MDSNDRTPPLSRHHYCFKRFQHFLGHRGSISILWIHLFFIHSYYTKVSWVRYGTLFPQVGSCIRMNRNRPAIPIHAYATLAKNNDQSIMSPDAARLCFQMWELWEVRTYFKPGLVKAARSVSYRQMFSSHPYGPWQARRQPALIAERALLIIANTNFYFCFCISGVTRCLLLFTRLPEGVNFTIWRWLCQHKLFCHAHVI